MFQKIIVGCVLLISSLAIAQESVDNSIATDTVKIRDTKYREDQFYFGITHSILQDKPPGFRQRSLSLGIQTGFVRDFPVNAARTWAIAPGVGYSYLNLHHNLAPSNGAEFPSQVLESYDRNTISLHYLDFPLEIRWRTSTPDSHKFWRIYTGFKACYLITDKAVTSNDMAKFTSKNNGDLNKWVYGVYISAGFNTWNVYMYYGLNSIYKNQVAPPSNNKVKAFNAGLMFYIL
ncbi:porin family protein [Flavobacterium sp. NKUCC04_CG]|uniref:porin family protein n=1 Tax=Flavobacterium sp. NKUCC04_CG TaxID=2842121 RepID=UPI001C5AE9E8|nr:porin family protein [Flavobacterium sp. NKUCC04_CG]MBW3518263.1 PorT family protein [Flavobacterium sp. NKUCC04_CG]